MNFFLRRWIPGLSALSRDEFDRVLDAARRQVFGAAPLRWVLLLLASLVMAMLVPLALITVAADWFFATALRPVVLVAAAATTAPLLHAWLTARALLPEVRRLAVKH
jgi:hypothetical protein